MYLVSFQNLRNLTKAGYELEIGYHTINNLKMCGSNACKTAYCYKRKQSESKNTSANLVDVVLPKRNGVDEDDITVKSDRKFQDIIKIATGSLPEYKKYIHGQTEEIKLPERACKKKGTCKKRKTFLCG